MSQERYEGLNDEEIFEFFKFLVNLPLISFSYFKLFLIIESFVNNFFLLKNSFSPLLRFFVAKILHRTVLHCILNDSHKYCCHFSMKTCSCPSRNDDPLKFIKLKFSIGHTKFRFIFFFKAR